MSTMHPHRHLHPGACALAGALLAGVLAAAPAAGQVAQERRVELRSDGREVRTWLPPGTRDIEVERQLHGGCRFTRTWGYDLSKNELWVDGGCGAVFRLVGNFPADAGQARPVAPVAPSLPPVVAGNQPVRPVAPANQAGRAIRAEAGGLCLDMRGREVVQGAPAILWTCNGGRNQLFAPGAGGEIKVGGMCLQLGGAEGAALVAMPCNGGPAQRWERSGAQIRSQQDGRCLDVRTRMAQGEPVVLSSCDSGSSQRWSW